MEDPIISGIAFNRDEAEVNISECQINQVLHIKFLGPIAEANIDVDMIIQNIGQRWS